MIGTLFYSVAWLLFGFLHSVLARPAIQASLESYVGCWYRLFYNLLSLIKILLVFAVGRWWLNNVQFEIFHNTAMIYAAYTVQAIGLALLVVALAKYDLGRFSGITQVITGEKTSSVNNEPLQRDGLNRFVRHPLYTGAFLVCLLYTSPSPRDATLSRMPSSA